MLCLNVTVVFFAYCFAHFFSVMIFITKSVTTVRIIPRGRQIQMFCTNPDITNITKEIAATVIT